MPIYEIEHNGKTYEVDAPDADTAASAFNTRPASRAEEVMKREGRPQINDYSGYRFGREVVRQVGRSGQILSTGLLSPLTTIADMASTPIRAAMSMAGLDSTTSDQALRTWLDDPELRDANALERGVRVTGEAVASVPTGISLGQWMSAAGAPNSTLRNVGEALAAAPASQTAAAVAGAGSAELAGQAGGGPLTQFAAGLVGGALGGYAFAPRAVSPGVGMLLDDRAGTVAAGTDDAVQTALIKDYKAAKEPFKAPYEALRNTKIQPAAEATYAYADIPSAAPIINKPDPTAPRVVTDNTRAVLNAIKAEIDINPEVRTALRGVGQEQPTIGHQMALISRVQGKANKAFRSGESHGGALATVAEAMQQDLDDTIRSLANRQLDTLYESQVIGPYKAIRGTFSEDPSKTWRRLVGSTPEQVKRTLGAASGETRNAIRKRVLAEIISREESYAGGSSGTGLPAIRQVEKVGLHQVFTPQEWRGIRAIANQMTWVKGIVGKSITLGGGASVGFAAGGPIGGIAGSFLGSKFDDYLTTPEGRRLLERAARMGPSGLREELMAVLIRPAGVSQAASQSGSEQQ